MGSRRGAPNLNFDFLFLDQVSACAIRRREPRAILTRDTPHRVVVAYESQRRRSGVGVSAASRRSGVDLSASDFFLRASNFLN
jgi:hypothetical protein